jgi:predicted anti-sigma-YlaC factor YlaD
MGAVLAAECERARSWASLGLDGELSQVEQALLRAHVGRCAQCAEFELDLEGLTRELRTAPLTRPPRAGVPARRRASGMRLLRVGASAAAAVVVAAGLGSLAGSLSSQPVRHSATAGLTARALRVAALEIAQPRPQLRPGARLQHSTPA